jgi:hypothetical protein
MQSIKKRLRSWFGDAISKRKAHEKFAIRKLQAHCDLILRDQAFVTMQAVRELTVITNVLAAYYGRVVISGEDLDFSVIDLMSGIAEGTEGGGVNEGAGELGESVIVLADNLIALLQSIHNLHGKIIRSYVPRERILLIQKLSKAYSEVASLSGEVLLKKDNLEQLFRAVETAAKIR